MTEIISSIRNSTSLKAKFIRYTLPSVAAMWTFSLYTMIDGIFVGRGVGAEALGAVNICMPFVNFIFAISMLFSTGVSTVISIYLGQGKLHKANRVFSFNLVCMIITSLVITIVSLYNLEAIAIFLGATSSNLGMVKEYLSIIMMFNGFFIVSYCLEILTKADGFPHLAIIGMVISAIVNIVLDYLFVILLGLGVKGAAIATIIAQGVSCLFFFTHFLRSKSKLTFVKFGFSLSILKRILFIGFPDAITELTSGIVILLFNQTILKYLGERGIVTYSIICYVQTLVIMTMIAITQGMQPLCSYYYGKKEKDKVTSLLKISLKTITMSSFAIFCICIIFAKPIVGIFIGSESQELFNYSVTAFRAFSTCFLILGYNVLISGFFASIEQPFKATIISLSRGLVIIIISLFTMTFLLGAKGIWYATLISEGICLIISVLILYRVYAFNN